MSRSCTKEIEEAGAIQSWFVRAMSYTLTDFVGWINLPHCTVLVRTTLARSVCEVRKVKIKTRLVVSQKPMRKRGHNPRYRNAKGEEPLWNRAPCVFDRHSRTE